jgi:hypothetical protein
MEWTGATYCTRAGGRCHVYWPEHRYCKHGPIYYAVTIAASKVGKHYSLMFPDCYTRANMIELNIEDTRGEAQVWFAEFLSGNPTYHLYVNAHYGWKVRRIRVRSIAEWLRRPKPAKIHPQTSTPRQKPVIIRLPSIRLEVEDA